MFKEVVCEIIRVCCRIKLLRMLVRQLIRAMLHCSFIPQWLGRCAMAMSDLIPLGDIKCFKTVFENRKITILISPQENWVVSRVYWRGAAFVDKETTAIFRKRAYSANGILDIGANWGYYTLLAAAVAPRAKIVAFEPHPFWFKKLEENMSINRLENILVENIAVGKTTGVASYYIDAKHPSASSMVKAYFRENETPIEITTNVTTIDEYVLRRGELAKIDLVKIDVETSEGDVLSGMKMVIERDSPDIICEVLPDEGLKYRIVNRKAIHNIITGLGYSAYWISERGLVREDSIEGHFPFSNYLFAIPNREAKRNIDVY